MASLTTADNSITPRNNTPISESLREAVHSLLRELAERPGPEASFRLLPILDDERGHYVLIYDGWDRQGYGHLTLAHIELRGDKLWILRDDTEAGIATRLVSAGVSPTSFVLGFLPEELRRYSEYASH